MHSNSHSAHEALSASQEQLMDDFKGVITDAEALIAATADQGDAKFQEMRNKARESMRAFNSRVADSQAVLLAKSKEAAKATDAYVHQNPWAALGVASGVGLLIGLLLRRS